MPPETGTKFRLWALAVGGLAGLLLALQGLLQVSGNGATGLSAGAVASVNGREISRERFAALASDLAADSSSPLDDADYRFVMDRLIDEELLIERGIELGLPVQDPMVRKSIAAAVIGQVATEAAAVVPGPAELRSFYESEAAFFSRNPRYRVHWWRFPGTTREAAQEASDWAGQLAGNLGTAGNREQPPVRESVLPDVLLPAAKLNDYLGPELLLAVRELAVGEVAGPVESGQAVHVLQLLERQDGGVPAFEAIQDQVAAEYRRRQGEEALLNYLHWLRSRAAIVRLDHARP